MSLAFRSPGSRKSASLTEHNLNLDLNNVTLPVTRHEMKAKVRMSMSSLNERPGRANLGVSVGDEMSPRRKARRSMQPRKSILKPLALAQIGTDDTMEYTTTHQYAHTVAFSGSLARRVSFAPNAHVRMIVENNYNANGSNPPPAPQPNIFALPPGATTSPHSRSSLTHNARRTSIPNIPAVFVGEGEVQGEESMDLETDSEASDSDDDLQAVKHHISIIGDDADAEGEEDMDVTQVVYGGIVRRASMAADTSITSETSGIEADGDEEKTMDFTIAIGGLLPHSPPVGAVSDRLSLGYSVPMSPDSAGRRLIPGVLMEGEADMELELDETVALGGIVGADESLSSGGEDTVGTAPREKTMTFSYGDVRAPQPTDDGGIAGGGIQATALPTNTRPMSGTPSFARSTMSSAQKEKRNVFAPSPSPFKSTPRKSGMETAGEVAKRLSFGSTASSGGKKRAREDDVDENGSAKKGRSGPAEEVFGLSTDQVFSAPVPAPRRSLGTPKRSAKSPAKSPALRRMMGEVVEPSSEEPEWDQPPTISLAQFLDMTGVQFMEGLPGLNRRRSSVARGVLGQSYAGGDREFALHEYADAHVQSVFLNMYTWASNKMKDDIKQGQADLLATEDSCTLDNPPVIREYLSASEEDRQLFEMTFKAFKTNTQLKAREGWYDWKMSLMGKVRPDVEEMVLGMKEDNDRLTEMGERARTLLPSLRARQAALQAELEREREAVAELAGCDQQELADYRAAIAEQNTQIAGFTKELTEISAKLNEKTAALDELKSNKAECTAAINLARSRCDRYTRSDVVRLQEEYTSMQALHLWRPTSIEHDRLDLIFDDEIRLSFACAEHIPILASATIELVTPPKTGDGPTEALLVLLRDAIQSILTEKSHQTLPAFVQRIGQLWTAAQSIRAQFKITALRHPLTYSNGEDGSLVAIATMVIPAVKSKVELAFIVSPKILRAWPNSVGEVAVHARVIYGAADADKLTAAARETVGTAVAEGFLGVYLQACVDAAGQY